MPQKQWGFLPLMLTLLCYPPQDSGRAPVQLDVRAIKDCSIVAAETAVESENYATEEFRDFFAETTGHHLPIRSQTGLTELQKEVPSCRYGKWV